ncbi:hypothetical protein V8F33_000056 [Rhypophila sp. PSN 637]
MPFEILTWIFKFLVEGLLVPSKQEVYRLCLTHSKLRSVAERLLYANIVMHWFSDQPPPIVALVWSLQRRPELANCVQSIELAGSCLHDNLILRDFKSGRFGSWHFGHDGSMEDAPEYFKWQQFPNAKAWKDALRRGSPDAVVAYLLFTVRKSLRSLRLDINHVLESPSFVASLFGNALYGSHLKRTWEPSFSVLRSVRIDHPSLFIQDNGRIGWKRDSFHYILPYLYLPSVEHLKLTISNASHDSSGNHDSRRCWSILEDDTSESRPMPTSLKTLELDLIREGRLGQILKVAKVANLTSLRWTWFYDQALHDNKYMTNIIDMDQIAADLSHVSQTLKELSISAVVRCTGPDIITIKGSDLRATFSPFNALRRLQIPLAFLVGFSPPPDGALTPWSLPRTLEHLILTDDISWRWRTEDVESLFREWLLGISPGETNRPPPQGQAYWEPYTPNLKTIHLVTRESEDYPNYERYNHPHQMELRCIAELAGVKIVFPWRNVSQGVVNYMDGAGTSPISHS